MLIQDFSPQHLDFDITSLVFDDEDIRPVLCRVHWWCTPHHPRRCRSLLGIKPSGNGWLWRVCCPAHRYTRLCTLHGGTFVLTFFSIWGVLHVVIFMTSTCVLSFVSTWYWLGLWEMRQTLKIRICNIEVNQYIPSWQLDKVLWTPKDSCAS